MSSEYDKALNLIKSDNNDTDSSIEKIKLNSNHLEINRIIGIYKIRKTIAKDKNNNSLANDFSKLVSSLEIASKKYDYVRILSYMNNNIGCILFVNLEIDECLGKIKGLVNEDLIIEND